MGFQFRLATVLRLRESLKKQEERALQRIQLEITQTTQEVEQTDEAIACARRSWQAALLSPTAAVHLQSMLSEECSLTSTRQVLMEKLERLTCERDKQLVRYRAAHRNYEALVNLSAEQLAAYEQQQARAQQKLLDDIFMARMRRGRVAGWR